MAKMSKEKGKRGEREFASLCRDNGYDGKRGQQYNGLDGEDVVGLPNIHIEVKRVEKLNLYDAMAQSISDSNGKIPIVAHRKNKCGWMITMRANNWFGLYRNSDLGVVKEKNGD